MRFNLSCALPRYLCAIFSLTFFLAAPPAPAAGTVLTLSEAQRLATEHSRQLTAQDSAVTASREMAAAAGQLPDPTLKLGVDNLPVDGADQFNLTRDFMTMRRIGVMQEFTREEKRQLRTQRFEREAEKSAVEKTATLAAIYRDTALAWFDRYYAEAMTAVITEQIKAARLEVDAAESAYRAGRGSQADIFAARSTVASLEDRSSETGRRIRTATTTLARWVGAGAENPLGGKPDIESIPLNQHALDAQLTHHPQIALLAKQAEIAATEVRLAQANKKPDWSMEVIYSQRGPAYSNMVSVGVAIPLQWDQQGRQNRELAAKLALADQADALRDEALRAHVAEVRSMIQEWDNGRERHARYERELVPLAGKRAQAVLAAYRGGKASLGDVLAARRNEFEVRIQSLQLEMETARLWAQINFLVPADGEPTHAALSALGPSMKESK
jgi:outer membrane protein TolC